MRAWVFESAGVPPIDLPILRSGASKNCQLKVAKLIVSASVIASIIVGDRVSLFNARITGRCQR
jgi:hypothetical protein